jgi:hypothetical protein
VSWPTREQIEELLDHDATVSDLAPKLGDAVDMALWLKSENERLQSQVAEFEIAVRSMGS